VIISVKTFDLKHFTKNYSLTSLSNNDLGPIFWALRFNFNFECLSAKHFRFDKESLLDLAEALKYNITIRKLILSDVNGTKGKQMNVVINLFKIQLIKFLKI
jgi:hypothetical protein